MPSSRRDFLRSYGPLLVGLAAILLLAAFGSLRMRGLLLNSGRLTLGVLAISVPLGGLLGIAIAKTNLPGRRLAAGLMVGSLLVPLYVHAAAWQTALGEGGWATALFSRPANFAPLLHGWVGAIWVHGIAATSWIALLTAASLLCVERQIEEESLLDAQPWKVLWRVSLRRGMGGLLTGAIWVAVVCGTEIAVTDLFAVRTFAEEIYTEASLGSLTGGLATSPLSGAAGDAPGPGIRPSDLTVGMLILLILVSMGLHTAARWMPASAELEANPTWRWSPTRGRRLLAAVFGAILLVAVVVPIAGLAWKAGARVGSVDGSLRREWSAVKLIQMTAGSFIEHRREWLLSFSVGAIVALVATLVGGLVAWNLRSRRLAAWAAGGSLAAALAIPAPLVGVWTIRALNHPYDSPLGSLTWLYDHTQLAPAIVQFVRAFPLVLLVLWVQLATVPQELLDAAASDGAGPWRRLWYVALPIRWIAAVAAGAVALVVAMGELPATLLVYPPGVTPLSVRVFQLLHYGVDDRVAALSLAVLLSVLTLTAAIAMAAKRLSQNYLGRRTVAPRTPQE